MPEELRPNVCKVVIGWPWGMDRETVHVYPYPDHEDAWQKNPHVAKHLKMILQRGGKIVVYVNSQKVYSMYGDMAFVGTEAEFAQMLSGE